MTGSLLEDPLISNESLDLKQLFAINQEEVSLKPDLRGFSVYGENIYVFGPDGLFTIDFDQ